MGDDITAVTWFAIAATLLGASWTVPALVRRGFRDSMRLHLFAALSLMGIGNFLNLPPVSGAVDAHAFIGCAKLAYNVSILVSLCLMTAFLRERPLDSWPALRAWEAWLCAACLAGMFTATALMPPHLRDNTLNSGHLGDPRVAAFYNIGNVYLLAGYSTCTLLAWRIARRGRPLLRRVSLTALSGGLAVLAASCLFRFLWVDVPALRAGQSFTYNHDFVLALSGTAAVAIGTSLPCLVSLAQVASENRDHRARFEDLGELWSRLVTAYPELVLDCRPGGSRRFPPTLNHAPAVYRRYVECRDGLTRLSPYIRLATAQLPAEASPGEPHTAARLIDRALSLYGDPCLRGESSKAPSCPVLVARDASDSYDEDVLFLAAVSSELQALRAT